MIYLNNISLNFGANTILDNISLQINSNDRIGLIGKNGAGKSTLFTLLCGYTEPSSGEIIRSKDIKIGYLPQEGFQFKKKTLFEEASSAFEDISRLQHQIKQIQAKLEDTTISQNDHHTLVERHAHLLHQLEITNASKVEAETCRVLKGMGFRETDYRKNIDAFSGGWQMRAALSKLLLQEPNLLLLDEPTNHLDVDSIIWLEEYLKGLKGGLIIISHDKAFLDRNVTIIWELDKGGIHEYHGNYSYYEIEKEKRLELQTARHLNQQKRIKEIERFIERFRAKNTKASQVQSRIKMLKKLEKEELPENTIQKIKFRFPPAKQSGVNVLEAENISYAYGNNTVFRDVCLSIERGEKVALVGKNGSGKSTLLRIITGTDCPHSGTIKTGNNILIDYFTQEAVEGLMNQNTVLYEVESVTPFSMIAHVRNLLGAFLFTGDDVYKTVNVLSGGEKSRLALVKILLKPTNFLVLDEPTNHIDITTKKVLKDSLLDYPGSVLIVSHDRDFLEGLVTKVYELKDSIMHTHWGSFRDFLDKKEGDFYSEITDTVVHNTTPLNPKEESTQKQQYLQKKEQNAKKRKLSKEVQKIEEKITTLEEQKKELDNILQDPELYRNEEKSASINKQYKSLHEELNYLYHCWETAHNDLECINSY